MLVRVCVERESAVLSKQTPPQKQAISEREKPEDLELVLPEEGRREEQPEDMVEYEQQPHATPQRFAPPLPPAHPEEEMEHHGGCLLYTSDAADE